MYVWCLSLEFIDDFELHAMGMFNYSLLKPQIEHACHADGVYVRISRDLLERSGACERITARQTCDGTPDHGKIIPEGQAHWGN
jgi:hypothetical protein